MGSKADISGLTPLKIPGKRYRKPAGGDEPNKRRRNPGGRPRKEAKKKSNSVARRVDVLPRRLEDLKSERQMSSFEKLPTEVLENIFLQSMNYNLPRSSPVLTGRLSSNYTYIQTLINGLGVSWHRRFIIDLELGDDDTDVLQVAEDLTDLLKLRWVTVPLLREARRRWLTKNFSTFKPEQIAFRYKQHKRHFLSTHPEHQDRENWPDTLEAVLGIDEYFFTLPHSAAIESARPFDDDGEPQLCRGMLVYEMLSPDLNSTTLPPEHALKGPWTEDKLLYLFWLAWAGCTLEFAGSTILPEVASQGLQDAIQEGNLLAISLLQLIGISHFSHEDIFQALSTTPAANRAILIVRVLDLFLCGCHKSSPKGTWEHWVEDIITMYGREQETSERNKLMKELKTEVYGYARTAYSSVVEFREADEGPTEEVVAILRRST